MATCRTCRIYADGASSAGCGTPAMARTVLGLPFSKTVASASIFPPGWSVKSISTLPAMKSVRDLAVLRLRLNPSMSAASSWTRAGSLIATGPMRPIGFPFAQRAALGPGSKVTVTILAAAGILPRNRGPASFFDVTGPHAAKSGVRAATITRVMRKRFMHFLITPTETLPCAKQLQQNFPISSRAIDGNVLAGGAGAWPVPAASGASPAVPLRSCLSAGGNSRLRILSALVGPDPPPSIHNETGTPRDRRQPRLGGRTSAASPPAGKAAVNARRAGPAGPILCSSD
jgi:hypothetical protein